MKEIKSSILTVFDKEGKPIPIPIAGVTKEYVKQNFANVIRNEAEGTVISVNDVSPFPQIVEMKVTSDTIPDLTQAKVCVVGQNILPFPYFESSTSKYGATITVNPDGTVLIDSKGQPVTNDVFLELTPISESPYNDILSNAGYAGFLTGCPKGGSKETYSLVQTYSGATDIGEGITISLSETYWRFYIRVKKGVTCNNLLFKPQITIRKSNLSGVALPYEPYKSFEYTPTESGEVKGVQSIYPNMTAFGEGLYVSMKYNADTNKVVENLQSQIEELKKVALSLGGNI